jgi:hypothetical protein
MLQFGIVKKDAASVPQPQHEARVLRLRIEPLEERIAPYVTKMLDQMTPK